MNKSLRQIIILSLFGTTLFSASLYFFNSLHPDSISSEPGPAVANFKLLDHLGKSHELYRYKDARAIVIFIHGVGCPIVRNSLRSLESIQNSASGEGVVFLLLNPNTQDSRANILKEAQEYKIIFPILKDESQLIAHSLGVERTAEAIVIDPKSWRKTYHGPIDDRLTYGAQKPSAQSHFLREALRQAGKKQSFTNYKNENSGCLITYEEIFSHINKISYEKDVAPILEHKCMSCHNEKGPGPWSMKDFRTVKGWSSMIHEVLRTERMPPWSADPEFGTFTTDISITPQEKRIISLWIENGAVMKSDEFDPLPSAINETHKRLSIEWPLGKPDIVLSLDEQKLPAEGEIAYRYMTVLSPVKRKQWIRAVDLRPSNTQACHHAGAFIRKSGEDLITKTRVFKDSFLAGYLPGNPPIPFPANTGKRLDPEAEIFFQFHYNATGKEEIDHPKLGLYLSDDLNVQELITGSAFKYDLNIPPGEPNHQVKASMVFDQAVTIMSLVPHMHYRGKSVRYEVIYPDGKTEILLSVPAYNFDFQWLYRFKQPKHLPAGTQLICSGVFDNSPGNPRNPDPTVTVKWGEQTTQEMFLCLVNYIKS